MRTDGLDDVASHRTIGRPADSTVRPAVGKSAAEGTSAIRRAIHNSKADNCGSHEMVDSRHNAGHNHPDRTFRRPNPCRLCVSVCFRDSATSSSQAEQQALGASFPHCCVSIEFRVMESVDGDLQDSGHHEAI